MNSLVEELMSISEKFNEDIQEIEREKRMNIIAQNGATGCHYELDAPFGRLHTSSKEEEADERKATPVYSGCISYFPDALKEIAKCSYEGQKQHNPDKPLGWDRSKSGDELDAMMRHLMDYASGVEFDECGTRHIVKCGWRMLAYIQKEVEK